MVRPFIKMYVKGNRAHRKWAKMVARGCGLVEVNVALEICCCEKWSTEKGVTAAADLAGEQPGSVWDECSGCTRFVLASKNVFNHTKAESRTLQCGRKAWTRWMQRADLDHSQRRLCVGKSQPNSPPWSCFRQMKRLQLRGVRCWKWIQHGKGCGKGSH